MAVILEKKPNNDVIISLSLSGNRVAVMASSPSNSLNWNLGHFEQDADGRLFFNRCQGIYEAPGYPRVAPDSSPGGKIKVT